MFPEFSELNDEIRRLFGDLERSHACEGPGGTFSPPLDVLETDRAYEVRLDLAGVPARSLRVVLRAGRLIVLGDKPAPAAVHGRARFHRVERAFGRFVRTLRLDAAIDAGRARAVLQAGELRITIPLIDERRGRDVVVPIES